MARRRWSQREYGSIRIIDAGDTQLLLKDRPDAAVPVRQMQYVWTPAAEIQDDLPIDFKIIFQVYVTGDGQRRFVPVGGLGEFTPQAWLAGLAILTRFKQLSPEQIFSYRIMHLIFERARFMQAHLDRAFSSPADLTVKRSGRGGSVEASILPASLGKDPAGVGRRWSVTQLLTEGRTRADQEGTRRCSQAQAIAWGLMVAAEKDPLEVSEAQSASLVRMALFDIEATGPSPTEQDIAYVEERLLLVFEAHQADSQVAFNRWYRGGKSNLPKSLARQAGAAGGRLDVELVNRALLELVWRSYQYEAGCLNLFAQALMQALPEPLEATERVYFSQVYQPQAYLGGLPLVMIRERISLLRPLLSRIWESPEDQSLKEILWRVLQYYSEMVCSRRQADRQSKAKPTPPTSTERGTPLSPTLLAEYAEELGVKGGIRCETRDCQIDFELEVSSDALGPIVVSARCRKHGQLSPIRLTARVAEAILGKRA